MLWAWTCPSHSGMDDTCLVPCVIGSCPLGREGPIGFFFFSFFFGGRNLTCRPILPMTAIPSRQIKETSRIVGHTARPTPGEAVSPWQATGMVHHDNLMGPPSRGDRIQSRIAPGMYHPCLSERDTSKPRARRWPLTGGRLPREPTYDSILQPCSNATPVGDVEGNPVTEQCGLTPTTPSVCTALSLEQAPTGQSKQSMSASRQPINQSCMPARCFP